MPSVASPAARGERTDGRTDGHTDGWTDGRTNVRNWILLSSLSYIYIHIAHIFHCEIFPVSCFSILVLEKDRASNGDNRKEIVQVASQK